MEVRVPTNTSTSPPLSSTSTSQSGSFGNASTSYRKVSSEARGNAGKSFSGHTINNSPGTHSGLPSVMPDGDVVVPKLTTPSGAPLVRRSVASASLPDEFHPGSRLSPSSVFRPSSQANISLPSIREDEVYEDKPDVRWKRVYWTFRGRLDFQPMRINLMRQHLHHALEPLLSILADDRNEVSVIRHKEAPYVVSVDMNAYELGKIPSLGPHFASLLRYEADDDSYPYVFWHPLINDCISIDLLKIRFNAPGFS